ncbi:long-chain-fatty-acid--CoA ligase [Mobilicoccus caccae]|uniref:AMP-dependent synthetase n=1 Tax=Mobilicoccus caccae TaxID=1859295 RepID=A0ABQ6IUH3_9MICO|nr:long-chain fatty acid--CoA ligase [Mobilicoccus caccae]GMA40338.1 AMP-dependent synthetase [Mobilicoccus caccae]
MPTLSVASILSESARRTPDKVALVQGDLRVTYAEAWRQARAVAAGLIARGVRPNDRVGLLAPNVTEFVAGYYGILAAGGTVVPVPTLLGPREAAYLLEKSGAKHVLFHASFETMGQDAAGRVGAEAIDIASLLDTEPVANFVSRSPEDIAVIFFTSGTTGHPKGALLTHLNITMNVLNNAFDSNPFQADDVVMGCLPLFHVFGQNVGMNSTLRVGGTLILQPRFDPVECLRLMHEHGATLMFGVPTMFVLLLSALDHPEAPEPPALRQCVSGGASLPVAVLEAFEKRFGTTIHEGYGLSETSPTITVNQSRHGTRPGTVGHPVWGVEVEIADPAVEDEVVFMPTGERGEVVARGHAVFAGYLDDPEATRRAVVDGWFRTGDIGIKDSDGFISIVDRKTDLIIRGGFNIYPREVEETFNRHPAVDMVAVVGVPDDVQGEEVCAVVTVQAGAEITVDELIAYGRENLAKHKYPRRVEIVQALPMGPSLKILKRELRRTLAQPGVQDATTGNE